jgi:hypothetical protein
LTPMEVSNVKKNIVKKFRFKNDSDTVCVFFTCEM